MENERWRRPKAKVCVNIELINSSCYIEQLMATHPPPEHKIVSALTARTQFGRIMRRASGGRTRFVVERRGEPQVVIMGIKDFLATLAPEKRVLAAIRSAARKTGKNRLSLRQINREIRAYRRDRSL